MDFPKSGGTTILYLLTLLSSAIICTSLEDNHTQSSNVTQPARHYLGVFPGFMTELSNIPELYDFQAQHTAYFNSSEDTSFAVKRNPHGYPSIALYGNENTTSVITIISEHSEHMYELNITLYYCPPGLVNISTLGACICPSYVLNPHIMCDLLHYNASIFVGFCASRENGSSPLLTVRCAFSNRPIESRLPIPQNITTGETKFCEMLHRNGSLCSECMPDYGISVFSDSYDCIKCRNLHLGNLILYLVIELLPTTIFFMAILFFHIGITTGAANGFIFFAQMITTPLEVLFLTYAFRIFVEDNKYFTTTMSDFVIDPYCIWNLNFFRLFHADICLHPGLKVVHVIALQYASAFYPLLFLMITYIVIELKARNIHLVTFLWRLFCFACVRWRRVWKAKTSVIDAFASCILLSYTKFMLVSLYYISPSNVIDESGKHVHRVLSMDTSIPFLGSEHRPYLITAIVVLLTFGAFPPLVLTCYQFQPFQNCLECLRLKGPRLQRFVEAFQGCYKDGTDGKVDCRFFAGLYFVFRVIILTVNAASTSYPIGLTFIVMASSLFLLLFAIFRPYKKRLYNVVDAVIIFVFTIVTTLQMYIYNHLEQMLTIPRIFLLYYVLLYIPLAYMIVYVVVWLYQHWKQRHNQAHTPIDREPAFFRESVMDDRAPQSTAIRDVSFSRRNMPTQSEVSISCKKEDHDESVEIRRDWRRRDGRLGRRGIREEEEEEEDESGEEVRQKQWSERDSLVHQELEPVMHYGSLRRCVVKIASK